jgi:hypothetical protein
MYDVALDVIMSVANPEGTKMPEIIERYKKIYTWYSIFFESPSKQTFGEETRDVHFLQ